MTKFLSCDWGTSTFRLRLVDTDGLNILAEENSGQGISATYNLWLRSANVDQQMRVSFYLEVIREHISKIEAKERISLAKVPVILSGMASSSIGMFNVPYGDLPFELDGTGVKTMYIEPQNTFEHPILLISGVKSNTDVMRGEETQLIGAFVNQKKVAEETVFILPGTHSKHIFIKDDQVLDFKTYMTGEYFELLSRKSILAGSVEYNEGPMNDTDLKSFCLGVQKAKYDNLLHHTFLIRTNDLLGKLTRKENFYYLSGLLVGTELKAIVDVPSVVLCCSSNLKILYETALQELYPGKIHIFPVKWAEEASMRGQFRIFKLFNEKFL